MGENLQDHLMTGISFEVKGGVKTRDPMIRRESEAIQVAMKMYAEEKKGQLCLAGIGSHAYMPMVDSDTKDGKQEQDELIDHFLTVDDDPVFKEHVRSLLKNTDEGSGALFMILAQANWHGNPPQLENFATLGVIQTHPMSRGSVHIASKDVSDPPKIESNYLSHPLDIEVYARHILFLQTLAKTEPLASYLKPGGKRNHPTAFLKNLDDAKEYAR